MVKMRRVGIYVRVSTDEQTTASQKQELQTWAARAGHAAVRIFEDQGISGAKGRDKRPAFDALLKAAVRREIDMIAVWSSDRLGRSLSHLIEVLQTIRDTGTALYIHTQSVDTTTPAGRVAAANGGGPRPSRGRHGHRQDCQGDGPRDRHGAQARARDARRAVVPHMSTLAVSPNRQSTNPWLQSRQSCTARTSPCTQRQAYSASALVDVMAPFSCYR